MLLELLDVGQPALRLQRHLDLLVSGIGWAPDSGRPRPARSGSRIRGDDVVRGQAEAGQRIGAVPDPHRVVRVPNSEAWPTPLRRSSGR
jgi:hypothetical protein